jgi:hypothetical protein
MAKVETAFRYKERIYHLMATEGYLKCFICEESEVCLITDNEYNVLFELQADCSQNTGYLKLINSKGD